ncbi:hypothetical protein LQ327_17535 [Actinomycetospora endophytica]|uniref:ANTAR domain-containing protein n=1 Tax=Actinomycetospora endophytica TaxID=2291215 RepID=A0ABS8PB76_9PSEU|nr:hypothetical protein [Actinomycetospora endophytica]MCD2195172.1 hypothetical protein [Actinomycetospora endophytica]
MATIHVPPPPPRIDGNAPVLAPHEKSRLRAAAHHARRALPGPVGDLVSRELVAYADFGHRMTVDSLIHRLAADVLARPTLRPDQG